MPKIRAVCLNRRRQVIIILLCVGMAANAVANPGPFQDSADELDLACQVIDQQGPVSGATIFAVGRKPGSPTLLPLGSTETDADGRFKLTLSSVYPGVSADRIIILIRAPGKQFWWRTAKQTGQLGVLKLRNDSRPVTGRIIDNQGLPVVDAVLQITQVSKPTAGDARGNNAGTELDFPPAWSVSMDWLRAKTDATGHFQLPGVGSNRTVTCQLRGAGLANAGITIAGTSMIRDSAPGRNRVESYSANAANVDRPFVHVAQPSRPIRGIVVDRENGQPVPGARIQLTNSFGPVASMTGRTAAVADSQGQFRISGRSAGEQVALVVVPPADQPYFASRHLIAVQRGLEELDEKIELRRGRWLEGQIIDSETGQGVQANVYFQPLPENPFLDGLEIVRDPGNRRFGATDANGRFRVAAIPGPAIVAVTASPEFQTGPEIQALSDEERAQLQFAGLGNITRFQEIDNTDQEGDWHPVEINLSRGVAIQMEVVDSKGDPVSPLAVHGLSAANDRNRQVEDSQFRVLNLRPGESRNLWIQDVDQKLGAAVTVDATTTGPIRVVLKSASRVVGRLQFAKDQQPIPRLGLAIASDDSMPEHWIESVSVDSTGEFEFDSVVPGSRVAIYLIDGMSAMNDSRPLAELEIRPGELVDLGQLADGKPLEGPPQRRMIHATTKNGTGLPTRLSGIVLDEQGNPISGAQVQFNSWAMQDGTTNRLQTHAQQQSEASGQFQLNLEPTIVAQLTSVNEQPLPAALIITAPRYGSFEVSGERLMRADALEIRLRKENVIRGTVVDRLGDPLSGAVVSISSDVFCLDTEQLQQLNGSLSDNFHWQKFTRTLPAEICLSTRSGAIQGEVQTASDGAFMLRGIPRNSVFVIRVSHPDHPTMRVLTINRPIKPTPLNSSDSGFSDQVWGSRQRLQIGTGE